MTWSASRCGSRSCESSASECSRAAIPRAPDTRPSGRGGGGPGSVASLQQRGTTGHGMDAACHVAALLGGEQDEDARQLLGLARTAQRRVLAKAFHLLG